MKARLWLFGLATTGLLGLGLLAVKAFVPTVRLASRAEILAEFPKELRDPPKVDLEAVKRYTQFKRADAAFESLHVSFNTKDWRDVSQQRHFESLLKTLAAVPVGPFTECPAGEEPIKMYSSLPMKIGIEVAARSGDSERLFRTLRDSIKVAEAYAKVRAETWISHWFRSRPIDTYRFVARHLGHPGLTGAQRKALLALIPNRLDDPELALDALRRQVHQTDLPTLLDPSRITSTISLDLVNGGYENEARPEPGNFDGYATARLYGQIYQAALADVRQPNRRSVSSSLSINEALGKSLPDGSVWDGPLYAIKMNLTANSRGRLAAAGLVIPSGATRLRLAALRRLCQLALLRHDGQKLTAEDPFSGKPFIVDTKRRLIYSVDKNGLDDGGNSQRDLVASYCHEATFTMDSCRALRRAYGRRCLGFNASALYSGHRTGHPRDRPGVAP